MVANLIITRLSDNGIQTLGKAWLAEYNIKVDTLELPWRNNLTGVSCIPKGIYNCKKNTGSTKCPYLHFDILNVPGRKYIKGHKGNFHTDINGCVLFGMGLKDINNDGQKDVINSGIALQKLLANLPNEFILEIK